MLKLQMVTFKCYSISKVPIACPKIIKVISFCLDVGCQIDNIWVNFLSEFYGSRVWVVLFLSICFKNLLCWFYFVLLVYIIIKVTYLHGIKYRYPKLDNKNSTEFDFLWENTNFECVCIIMYFCRRFDSIDILLYLCFLYILITMNIFFDILLYHNFIGFMIFYFIDIWGYI